MAQLFNDRRRWVMALLACAALSACAGPTQIITGTPRPATTAAQVKIYSAPPAQFQEIAILDASSHSVFTTGGQKAVDKVVLQLKEQMARLNDIDRKISARPNW